VPRLALLALVWGALTGHVFSGCKGLFSPAVPEPPSGPPIVLDYRSPEATLRTMAAGIQAKGPGASAWFGAFADSTRPDDGTGYHQFFDQADKSAFESSCGCEAPTDWRLSQEQTFFLEFLNVRPSDDYLAVFDSVETNPDPPAGDTEALLFRRYRVLATSTDGNTTTIIAIGFADLIFTKKASSWLITRWVDHVDPDVGVNPTDPEQLTLGRRRLEASR
jgi:hypothetical protein